MKGIVKIEGTRLVWRYDELMWIEPWGENALRVRVTRLGEMPARGMKSIPGGTAISVDAPLEVVPAFCACGSRLEELMR